LLLFYLENVYLTNTIWYSSYIAKVIRVSYSASSIEQILYLDLSLYKNVIIFMIESKYHKIILKGRGIEGGKGEKGM